jgi:hypothetical protein
LVHILGLDYGIFDPKEARKGIQERLWSGMWRDKSPDGPARVLEQYGQLTAVVLEHVASLMVFVAPIDGNRELRRHVEGSIGWNLRNNHMDCKALYPDDNHIGTSATKMAILLEISSDEPIAGLDATLEI